MQAFVRKKFQIRFRLSVAVFPAAFQRFKYFSLLVVIMRYEGITVIYT